MCQLALLCLLFAAAPLRCLSQGGNDTDTSPEAQLDAMKRVTDVERMAMGVAGVCVEAAKCSKELFVDEVYNATVEGMQFSDFADYADIYCTLNTKAKESCYAQCPFEEGSVAATLQTGFDYVCDERLEDLKKAAQCAKKMTPEVVEAKCDQPAELGRKWFVELMEMVQAGTPLNKLADSALGENGFLATMCGVSSCYLDAIEEHSEKVCGDRKHGRLLRDVLEVIWPKLQELVQSLHVDCLIPDKCKQMP